jgi:EAL domain-containing protein (putative c-di-GMP-specific phosphodiesterase class I)
VSIGLTLFGAGESPAAILSRADIACYAAKAEGRNRTHAYRRDDPTMQADHLEIQRVAQLHAALADGSFQLVRQLIAPLDGDTRQPPFYELLLRLADADGRLLAPGGFLDVASRYGLMPIIDRWVMEQSFRYLAATVRPMRLSINLSGLTLNEPRFFDDVVALQERYGIDSADICFEVTESVAIERLTRAVAMMNRLVEAGFSFSLDDFGNGVASFGYLQELPVDFVKIDGRFIRDIQDDPANAVIVESLVKLADVKHIGCIGEWIETREVLEQVKALGVGYGQGYYLHLPEPLALHSPTRQTAS